MQTFRLYRPRSDVIIIRHGSPLGRMLVAFRIHIYTYGKNEIEYAGRVSHGIVNLRVAVVLALLENQKEIL